MIQISVICDRCGRVAYSTNSLTTYQNSEFNDKDNFVLCTECKETLKALEKAGLEK